jgi:hypothetical protein
MKTLLTITALCAALVLLGPGCGDGGAENADAAPQADGGAEDLDAEGCEHMKEGPFVDVSAGAAAATAGEVKSDHHAYRVALTTGQAGYVKYAAAAAGDHVFFLDANVPFAVQDDQGAAVAIEESVTDFTVCTEVAVKHTVELSAVGTYYLVLGPDAAATGVTIVVEAAGHHHD